MLYNQGERYGTALACLMINMKVLEGYPNNDEWLLNQSMICQSRCVIRYLYNHGEKNTKRSTSKNLDFSSFVHKVHVVCTHLEATSGCIFQRYNDNLDMNERHLCSHQYRMELNSIPTITCN